jgi:hypothetical protein
MKWKKRMVWMIATCMIAGSAAAQTLIVSPLPLVPHGYMNAGSPQGLFSIRSSGILKPIPDNTSPTPVFSAAQPLNPAGYYSQHFGFFCKQEWNWQKHTGLPVKVRLGNYQYTQKLEGKH